MINFVHLEMAEEALARAGLHIDDLNKIRLLEPEVTHHTTEIRDQCKDFLDSMFLLCMLVNLFKE